MRKFFLIAICISYFLETSRYEISEKNTVSFQYIFRHVFSQYCISILVNRKRKTYFCCSFFFRRHPLFFYFSYVSKATLTVKIRAVFQFVKENAL